MSTRRADTVGCVASPDRQTSSATSRVASTTRSLMQLATTLPGRRDDVLAIVNGLFGDELAERASSLAVPMTIRLAGMPLPLDRDHLRDALDGAGHPVSERLCVSVHGLMSTESVWRLPGARATSYASMLAEAHGVTPLELRYNTGRHISTNGAELSSMLDRLVRAWPVRVSEINFIAHSMGGLVVRSACATAGRWSRGRRLPIGRSWTSKVRRVVLIGVPNTGAPLEALVNQLSGALWALPVPATRVVGLGLDSRSAGIRDLRFGAIYDDDWLEQDPDARQRPRPHRVHRLRRARYLVIAGSVTSDPEHPLARIIGDALVTTPSATGIIDSTSDTHLFPGATTQLFPGITHISLAHHPDVHATIADWW